MKNIILIILTLLTSQAAFAIHTPSSSASASNLENEMVEWSLPNGTQIHFDHRVLQLDPGMSYLYIQGTKDSESDHSTKPFEQSHKPYCVLMLDESNQMRVTDPSNFNFTVQNVTSSGTLNGYVNELELNRIGANKSSVQEATIRCGKLGEYNDYRPLTIGELRTALLGTATVVLPPVVKI